MLYPTELRARVICHSLRRSLPKRRFSRCSWSVLLYPSVIQPKSLSQALQLNRPHLYKKTCRDSRTPLLRPVHEGPEGIGRLPGGKELLFSKTSQRAGRSGGTMIGISCQTEAKLLSSNSNGRRRGTAGTLQPGNDRSVRRFHRVPAERRPAGFPAAQQPDHQTTSCGCFVHQARPDRFPWRDHTR